MEVPRELLWATIIALVVTLLAVTHTAYQQPQQVQVQQQHGDTASGNSVGQPGPSDERTILGVRPGEWLLGLIAVLFWYAIKSFARERSEAGKAQHAVIQDMLRMLRDTAERQSRAYILVVDVAKVRTDPEEIAGPGLEVLVEFKNDGQT